MLGAASSAVLLFCALERAKLALTLGWSRNCWRQIHRPTLCTKVLQRPYLSIHQDVSHLAASVTRGSDLSTSLQVSPSAPELSLHICSLLWGRRAAIQVPHAADMPIRLRGLPWLAALGGRLDITLNPSQPAADVCLLPAIRLLLADGEGAHISRPDRISRSASLPLWQIAGAGAPLKVAIDAVVDPRCSYCVRYAMRGRVGMANPGGSNLGQGTA